MIDPEDFDFAATPVSPARPRLSYAPADPNAAPAVSIVTPFYDAGPVFEETVASVLGQSLQQWEWILVDDGSRDAASLALLAALQEREPHRVRVLVHAENEGRSKARNDGVRAARSELVFMLDQDDLLEPTALEKCAWFLATHPDCAFVSGWSVGFGAQEHVWLHGFDGEAAFLDANQVTGRALVRRSALEVVGGYDESMRSGYEDWDLWLRCADAGLWGDTIHEVLDWFRRRDPPAEWESAERMQAFRSTLAEHFPRFVRGVFPRTPRGPASQEAPDPEPPLRNALVARERRILVVAPALGRVAGGSVVASLVASLAAEGWQVTVASATAGDGAGVAACTAHAADVHALDRFLDAADHPRFLRHLVSSRRPEVVLYDSGAWGRAMRRMLASDAPAALHAELVHLDPNDTVTREPDGPGGAAEAAPALALATSPAAADAARGAGAVCVLALPGDPTLARRDDELRAAQREAWAVDDDVAVILCAGCFGPASRTAVIAEVALELTRRDAPFLLALPGEGDERAWMEDFVAKRALRERVRFVDPMRLAAAFAAADLVFAPSRIGFPAILADAAAAGLPFVAARAGESAEGMWLDRGQWIESVDDAHDAARFADALDRLARDRALRSEIASRGTSPGERDRQALARAVSEAFAAARPASPPSESFAAAYRDAVRVARVQALAADAAAMKREAQAQQRTAALYREGRDWFEQQAASWKAHHDRLLAQYNAAVADLRKANDWLQGQVESWRSQHDALLEHTKTTATQHAEATAWLESQVATWRSQHALLAAQHQLATTEFADAKQWLEQQVERWKSLHDEMGEARRATNAELERVRAALAEQQRWSEELRAAVEWHDGQRANWERIAAEHIETARALADRLGSLASRLGGLAGSWNVLTLRRQLAAIARELSPPRQPE